MVAFTFIIGGIFYLCWPTFLPYHAVIVGRPWWQLELGLQKLILALMRGGGGCSLAVGLALVFFIMLQNRGEVALFRWAIFIVASVGALPILGVSITLAYQFQVETPWPWVGGALLLASIGFFSWRPHPGE